MKLMLDLSSNWFSEVVDKFIQDEGLNLGNMDTEYILLIDKDTEACFEIEDFTIEIKLASKQELD